MNSIIISGVVSVSKSIVQRFKESKIGAGIENLNNSLSKSWHNSIITRALKSGNGKTKESVVKTLTMLPFTFF